jgi:hypothetical protein
MNKVSICSSGGESGYAGDWSAPDEAKKQKRRDYLNNYRKQKRAELWEARRQ